MQYGFPIVFFGSVRCLRHTYLVCLKISFTSKLDSASLSSKNGDLHLIKSWQKERRRLFRLCWKKNRSSLLFCFSTALLQSHNQRRQPPRAVPNHQRHSRWHAGSTVTRQTLTNSTHFSAGLAKGSRVKHSGVCLPGSSQPTAGWQPPLQSYLPQPFWDTLPPCTAACEGT